MIFINDLDEDINSHILKFADDTKLLKEVRNSADSSQLQADLDKLVLWAQKWQMEFNVDKCKVVHVGNSDDGSTYYMEGSELTKVSCEKDLGVWISDDMKCSKQCMHAFNKATGLLGMIKRTIRYIKDTRVMMSLYKTLVRPHVEYCVSAWNPHYIKDLIEKVQRRLTKMINNMEGKTYEERLQCLKLLTVEEEKK